MPFEFHKSPHHVHLANGSDHSACPEDHWEGGRPEPAHPHHVEIDCSTGLVGYTHLSDAEIESKRAREPGP